MDWLILPADQKMNSSQLHLRSLHLQSLQPPRDHRKTHGISITAPRRSKRRNLALRWDRRMRGLYRGVVVLQNIALQQESFNMAIKTIYVERLRRGRGPAFCGPI